jgi:hypothetical protein
MGGRYLVKTKAAEAAPWCLIGREFAFTSGRELTLGFQDQCLKPLGHPSVSPIDYTALFAKSTT